MSFWSAIGLADRKTVEELLSEIRSLREENNGHHQELNKTLVNLQEGQKRVMEHTAEESDAIKRMLDKMKEESENRYTAILEKLNADRQVLMAGIELLEREQSRQETDLRGQYASLNEILAKAEKAALERHQNILDETKAGQVRTSAEMSQECASLHNLLEQSEKRIQSSFQDLLRDIRQLQEDQEKMKTELQQHQASAEKMISEATETAFLQYRTASEELKTAQAETSAEVSRECNSMRKTVTEAVGEVSVRSQNMGEFLEKMENCKIMELEGQLSLFFEQFTEVQRSINDMWEIMKVVWVDSLLKEFEKSIG